MFLNQSNTSTYSLLAIYFVDINKQTEMLKNQWNVNPKTAVIYKIKPPWSLELVLQRVLATIKWSSRRNLLNPTNSVDFWTKQKIGFNLINWKGEPGLAYWLANLIPTRKSRIQIRATVLWSFLHRTAPLPSDGQLHCPAVRWKKASDANVV